jgi:soluble P-type ATPase
MQRVALPRRGCALFYYMVVKILRKQVQAVKNPLVYNKFMIELNIPGRGLIRLQHLVCDVNGTLAVDGQLLDGVKQKLSMLRDRLSLHLLTTDTHGRQDFIDQQLNLKAVRIRPGNEAEQKAAYIDELGADLCVAIGQGSNDASVLHHAALGICVLSPEGTAIETLQVADLVVANIHEALEMLDKPLRIVATLRK